MGNQKKNHHLLKGLALTITALGAAHVLFSTKQGKKWQQEMLARGKAAGKKLAKDFSWELEQVREKSQELIQEAQRIGAVKTPTTKKSVVSSAVKKKQRKK